jgi:hypothetical protein
MAPLWQTCDDHGLNCAFISGSHKSIGHRQPFGIELGELRNSTVTSQLKGLPMSHLRSTIFTLGFAFAATQAFAAAPSGGGTAPAAPAASTAPAPSQSTGTMTSPMQLHCKKGEVIKTIRKKGKPNKKMCVKAMGSLLTDPELYQQGMLLAKQGEYDWALSVFSAEQNQNDPATLTMMGYSNRKAGRLELGITYYQKALALDANYLKTREYLGEGYVMAGRIDLAKIQLNEIATRGGLGSEEYVDLKKAIDTAI